jgi:hypothetical protein
LRLAAQTLELVPAGGNGLACTRPFGSQRCPGVRRLFDAVEHPLTGSALRDATSISVGTRASRAYLSAVDSMVTAGLPLAMAGRGTPALPNTWPPHC